jgi:hypothetical protein
MKKQYLHLSAYPCDKCNGPVISGSLAIRENEISKETEIHEVGANCLSCGHRQGEATGQARALHFSPVEWEPVAAIEANHLTIALGNARNRVQV